VNTRRLLPLPVGYHVRIQNQTGPHPKKWHKRGVIIEVRQFDQCVVLDDGSGRSTLHNHKFLRRHFPVQAPQPWCTIHDDFRHITKLPANPTNSPTLGPTTCTPATPASNQPTPKPPPSQGPTSIVPTAAAPAHTSSSYPESSVSAPPYPIPEPTPTEAVVQHQQTITTPSPTPVSQSALTPPTPKCQPPRQHWHWGYSWTTTRLALKNHEHWPKILNIEQWRGNLTHSPLCYRYRRQEEKWQQARILRGQKQNTNNKLLPPNNVLEYFQKQAPKLFLAFQSN